MGYNKERRYEALMPDSAGTMSRRQVQPVAPGRSVLCVALAMLVLALAACGGEGAESVRGAVVDVLGPFVLGSIDIQDENGKIWHFEARGELEGFTPSHLREHMVQGLPVLVTYDDDGGALVIVSVTD